MKRINLGSGYVYYVLMCFFVSLGILFVSLVATSWEVLASEKNYDSYRVKPISVEKVNEEGRRVKINYKLPEIKTLPDNFFYGFKEIRNYIWLKLAREPVDKSKLLLFLADKRISESLLLMEKNKTSLSLKSARDAVKKLKKSKEWSLKIEESEKKLIDSQLDDARLVYREVFKRNLEDLENEEVLRSMATSTKNQKSELEELIAELEEWHEEE